MHLQIIQKDDGCFYVADFGSKNGTYINGKKVQGEVRLSSSDVVRIGNTTLPWKSYFPGMDLSKETEYQKPDETDWLPEESKPTGRRKKNDSDVDWHGVNEVKIDYNEGGFGRKFGQAAGDVSGNIVGCFIARLGDEVSMTPDVSSRLKKEASLLSNATAQRELEKSNRLFKERQMQLEQWQDEQIKAAQHAVDVIRQDLKAARRAVENAANLTEQAEASEKAASLERKLSKARRNIDAVEDAAEEKRSRILAELKKRLVQNVEEQALFILHWTMV